MVHHNFKKGKKIYCILKDNTVIIGKYERTTGHFLMLDNAKIPWSQLRSSTIYKKIKEIS